VLPVEERHTARALALLLDHQRSGLTPRDAVHVAVMETRGLSKVLSTDRHFDSLAQVERVDPAAFSRASS
jgi:predicted nucleic acid-binding protein